MCDFSKLIELVDFDYSQMRAVLTTSKNAKVATDEAINFFVTNINDFFDQFDHRKLPESKYHEFEALMNQILEKINEKELIYQRNKYLEREDTGIEVNEKFINSFRLKNFGKISILMQYWGATDGFNSVVRNPREHSRAARSIIQIYDEMNSSQQDESDYQISLAMH